MFAVAVFRGVGLSCLGRKKGELVGDFSGVILSHFEAVGRRNENALGREGRRKSDRQPVSQ